MVLTVSFALSPVIGLSCHRRWRLNGLARPVGLTRPPPTWRQPLRRQDHTTSPSAAALAKTFDGRGTHPPKFWRWRDQHRSSARRLVAHGQSPPCNLKRARRCRVHRIPPRRYQTIAIRPSCGVRRRELCRWFGWNVKRNIFAEGGGQGRQW